MPELNWTTVTWSACGAVCALLAGMHLVLWARRRPGAIYLFSALACVGATGTALGELALMKAVTPEGAAAVLRAQHVPLTLLLTSLAWFVHLYFRATSRWLPALVTGLWAVALVVNFLSPGSLVFGELTELRTESLFGGEVFAVPVGTPNPFGLLANLGVAILLIQVVLAAFRASRRGARHSAVLVGWSIAVFLVVGGATSVAVDFGLLPGPYIVSFSFLAIVLAMSYELASEAVRASDYGQRVEVAERNLARLREHAEQVDRVNALGELASVLAHELNQPLAAILSNAQAGRRFLDAGELDAAQQHEILDDIVRDDKRAAEVIHGMRAMLRKDAIEKERLELRPVVEEVVTMLAGELAQRGATCGLRFDPELAEVEASRVELQQVLINLLRNALDAMQEVSRGSRALAIEVRSRDGGVETSVSDSGPGITEELLPRIFEPLTTTKSAGTGMGLAICRRIVEARGGQLGAENVPSGARVWFRLPAAAEDAQPGGIA